MEDQNPLSRNELFVHLVSDLLDKIKKNVPKKNTRLREMANTFTGTFLTRRHVINGLINQRKQVFHNHKTFHRDKSPKTDGHLPFLPPEVHPQRFSNHGSKGVPFLPK
jgi:hypothetical protein